MILKQSLPRSATRLNKLNQSRNQHLASHEKSDPMEPARLNGTLLKCPGCRLKFPFSAENHPLEQKTFPPIGGTGGEPRRVLVTHCPQCTGWVTIS